MVLRTVKNALATAGESDSVASLCSLAALKDVLVTIVTGLTPLERCLTNTSASDLFIAGAHDSAVADAISGGQSVKNSGTILKAARYIRRLRASEGDEGGDDREEEYVGVTDKTNISNGTLEAVCSKYGVRPHLGHHLVSVLSEMKIAAACRIAIDRRQSQPVDPHNPAHRDKLSRLWTLLQQQPLPSEAWDVIKDFGKDSDASNKEAIGPDELRPAHLKLSLSEGRAKRNDGRQNLSASSEEDTPEEDYEHKSEVGQGLSRQRGGGCWRELGFHGYPFRDFRGLGSLGADCLLYFAEQHTDRAREVLHDAHNVGQSVPFAITGLNVTLWLRQMLDEKKLDIFFFNNPYLMQDEPKLSEGSSQLSAPSLDSKQPHHDVRQRGPRGGQTANVSASGRVGVSEDIFNSAVFEQRAVDVFCLVFCYAMLEFCRFWNVMRPNNILQFGRVANIFKENFRKTIDHVADSAAHSSWGLQANTGDELCAEMRSWIDGEVRQHHTADLSPMPSTDGEGVPARRRPMETKVSPQSQGRVRIGGVIS